MGNTGAVTSLRDRYAMRDLLLENRQSKFVDVTAAAGPTIGVAAAVTSSVTARSRRVRSVLRSSRS